MDRTAIDALLDKTDLWELVRRAGGEPDRGGRCPCPLHGGDNPTGFSLYQKDGRQLWNCLSGSCGGGDALTFIQKWQGFNFRQSFEFLGGDWKADPVELKRLAEIRHAALEEEAKATQLKLEARRKEIQVAELHIRYHESMKEWGRVAWEQRGVDECYQRLWFLGSCDDKVIHAGGMEYHTPTLTIPILEAKTFQLLNLKHRLMNPPKPTDKYRPEREGLGACPPFLAFPDLGYEAALTWVIEGEIKAMVAATITPDATWQYIGVPGRNAFDSLTKELFGKNVIVVPDPGAERDAWKFCKAVRGRWLPLSDKIDDLINANGYDADWLRGASKQARKANG